MTKEYFLLAPLFVPSNSGVFSLYLRLKHLRIIEQNTSRMSHTPNFDIVSNQQISLEFTTRGIVNFEQATKYIQHLPYSRNLDKNNDLCVFNDNCGTCSTKHTLLKKLADENNFDGISLILGLFRMNGINTPKVSKTLTKHNLDYIPEAHSYLRYGNQMLDYTSEYFTISNFESDIIEEIPINVNQITDFKITYHKQFLQKWILLHHHNNFTMDDLWMIREQCINDLSSAQLSP